MEQKAKELKKVFSLLDDDDPEIVMRQLTEEQAFRLGKEKYRFYEPSGKGEEFIKAVGCAEHFVVLFSAANGVGKTVAGANVVANIVFDSENPYFTDRLYSNWPYPKKGRIVSAPNNVEGVIDTLKEWLPEGKYTTRKAGKTFDSAWKAGDWRWDIMTYEQDPKEFEGPTLGWVWFDEPPTMSIYKACVARLRKGGIIFITATMLKGSAWLFDHIVEGRSDDPDMELLAKEQRHYIEADVESACKQHGVRGHLEHDHIQKMIAEYSEDEKMARVHGKFQHFAGLIFKKFTRKIHIIKPFLITKRDYCAFEMIDPHPRNPDAVMWVAVDKKGTKFIVDELYLKCETGDEELAQRIKGKASNYRIIRRLGDPSMFITDQHTKKSLATKLESYGLSYLEASKARQVSDRRIEQALNYSQLPTGEFIKQPEIYVFDNCRRTIFEFEHYRWDEWSGRTADKKEAKEKPLDRDDHMIENLGRCLIQEPTFMSMPARVDRDTQKINYDPYGSPIA